MTDFQLQGRCLVLGAGGVLGINLCNMLVACGATVTAYGRTAPPQGSLHQEVKWISGQFDDVRSLTRAVKGQEFVFHLISGTIPEASNRDPAADLVTNVLSTVRLLEVCCREGVRKIIFPSSGGTVYGVPGGVPIPESSPTEPISGYGISKLAIEKYLNLFHRLHGLDYHICRISNIYGPFQQGNRRQGLVAATIRRALLKEPVEIWGDGEVIRDFVYVDDVVAAMLYGCFYSGIHRVMNVGSGMGLTVNQVVRDIELMLDDGVIVKLYHPGRTVDVPANILDTSLIQSETQWRPMVSWHEGLCRSIDWMRGSVVASDPEIIREYANQALKFPTMSSGKPATAHEFEA